MVSQLAWLKYREVTERGWKDRLGEVVKVLRCEGDLGFILRAMRSHGRLPAGKVTESDLHCRDDPIDSQLPGQRKFGSKKTD